MGAALAALAGWGLLLLTPWGPARIRASERLDPGLEEPEGVPALADVVALVPARDESGQLGRTLPALAAQGADLEIVLVDDRSSDGTAGTARNLSLERLRVVEGTPPPPGWSGKLWALEQARRRTERPHLLLVDADVELEVGAVRRLRERKRAEGASLASLVAAPRMATGWEKLLMPAFVFFFRVLYPFPLANRPGSRVAAGAGGCALLDREALERAGGFAAVRGEVIDDCALAGVVKASGGRTWIGLTRVARSVRGYGSLRGVTETVARTAFTQLRGSTLLLLLCTLVMGVAFWAPPAAAIAGSGPGVRSAGLAAGLAMVASYVPTLRYYGRSPAWALLLPITGTLYLGMTWFSALRWWSGVRARWKGREYRRPPSRERSPGGT